MKLKSVKKFYFNFSFTGEICVCGPQVMKGYLNRPGATVETLKEWEGRIWCLTGDFGYMDKHGQIVIPFLLRK